MTWYAQVDDLVGGFIVANRDVPASHLFMSPKSRDSDKVIAECHVRGDAERIAWLLNKDDQLREVKHAKEIRNG